MGDVKVALEYRRRGPAEVGIGGFGNVYPRNMYDVRSDPLDVGDLAPLNSSDPSTENLELGRALSGWRLSCQGCIRMLVGDKTGERAAVLGTCGLAVEVTASNATGS